MQNSPACLPSPIFLYLSFCSSLEVLELEARLALSQLAMFVFPLHSGNLGRVDRICEWEYELFLRPDVANPRYRSWFNFTVENVYENQVC